jgi:hypothetical protein
VLDRITYESDEDEQILVTDRNYWEKRSTPKMLKQVDSIFESMQEIIQGFELNYNKFYIGMSKDGVSKNFLMFRPKKNYIYIIFRGAENPDLIQEVEETGLEISFNPRFKEYRLRINNLNEYKQHKELIDSLIKGSMEYLNVQ